VITGLGGLAGIAGYRKRQNDRMLPSPPFLVLNLHTRTQLHHSISDRGDDGGGVYLYKQLNSFTLCLVKFHCDKIPHLVSETASYYDSS
jgi:hypothetical protein